MVSESEDCSRHCQRNGLSPLQGNLSPRPYLKGEAKEVRVRATAHLTHQVPTNMCPGEWVTLYIIKREEEERTKEDGEGGGRGKRVREKGKGSEGEGRGFLHRVCCFSRRHCSLIVTRPAQ